MIRRECTVRRQKVDVLTDVKVQQIGEGVVHYKHNGIGIDTPIILDGQARGVGVHLRQHPQLNSVQLLNFVNVPIHILYKCGRIDGVCALWIAVCGAYLLSMHRGVPFSSGPQPVQRGLGGPKGVGVGGSKIFLGLGGIFELPVSF